MVIKNIAPLYWRYFKGSRKYLCFDEYKKKQWNSLEININEQKQNLFRLVKYCDQNVPYYKRVIAEKCINYSVDTIFDDIQRFPVLTKEILRKEFQNLKSLIKHKGESKNTSGGSTGEPAIFMQDSFYRDTSVGFTFLCYEWAKKQQGDYFIKLWGAEKEFLEGTRGFSGLLRKYLMNIDLLNAFKMSTQDMEGHIEYINKNKPVLIESYVQSIYELSMYIHNKDIKIHSPEGIITSAGTLYPKMKNLIEKVFCCKVYNRYGSREVGNIASSCGGDEGLHLNLFNHYVEILDTDLSPVKDERTGRVIVTTLNNLTMPLIRYDIGDMAVPTQKECSCGRGLPLIKQIEGRVGSMIKTGKGIIDSTALTTSFYFYNSISKYKFIQKSENYVVVKVVLNDLEKWNKDRFDLVKRLKKLLGEGVDVEFCIVQDIPPMKSGKYMYIESEVK